MRSLHRIGRHVLVASVVVTSVFAARHAFADGITLGPTSLGTGTSTVSACIDATSVAYPTPSYHDGIGYTIESVTVSAPALTIACAHKAVYVEVADVTDAALPNGAGVALVPTQGESVVVHLTGPVSAAAAVHVHIAIA